MSAEDCGDPFRYVEVCADLGWSMGVWRGRWRSVKGNIGLRISGVICRGLGRCVKVCRDVGMSMEIGEFCGDLGRSVEVPWKLGLVDRRLARSVDMYAGLQGSVEICRGL